MRFCGMKSESGFTGLAASIGSESGFTRLSD